MGTINRHVANVTAFAVAIGQMHQYPASVKELSHATGLHRNTIRKLVRALENQGVVTKRMEPDDLGRKMVPVYRIRRVE